MRFKLQGLEPGADYLVEDLGARTTQQASGADLMDPGLTIRIPTQPGSAIFSYRMVKKHS